MVLKNTCIPDLIWRRSRRKVQTHVSEVLVKKFMLNNLTSKTRKDFSVLTSHLANWKWIWKESFVWRISLIAKFRFVFSFLYHFPFLIIMYRNSWLFQFVSLKHFKTSGYSRLVLQVINSVSYWTPNIFGAVLKEGPF